MTACDSVVLVASVLASPPRITAAWTTVPAMSQIDAARKRFMAALVVRGFGGTFYDLCFLSEFFKYCETFVSFSFLLQIFDPIALVQTCQVVYVCGGSDKNNNVESAT